MKDVLLKIDRVRPGAVLPAYYHEGDSGMDVSAAEEVLLQPGQSAAVPTGLVLHIPAGYEIQVRPRSGLSLRTRLRLPNAPGTIDAGYRDELLILMHNASSPGDELADTLLTCAERDNRPGTYQIQPGDRIAQLVLAPVIQAVVTESVEGIDSQYYTSDRGGGFGSSGISNLN